MLKPFVFAVAAMLAIAGTAQAHTRSDRIDSALERAGFVGAAAAADASGVFHSRAAGSADRSARTPITLEQTWRWASVSKQVTAVLVMQQIDAGKFTVETPVSVALPSFKGRDRERITIRQLLQHTSGLPNADDSPVDVHGVPSFYTDPSEDRDEWCSGSPKTDPGTTFAYNNCDYLLLGKILERATGKPYAALVEERITIRLGLRSVGTVGVGHKATSPVIGYQANGKPEPAISLATFGAAGAIEGSITDMLAFDRALIDGSLLTAASREAMWTGDPRLGYAALGAWAFSASLDGCEKDVQLVERRGEIGGVQVRNFIARDQGVALVMLSNTSATDFGEVWQGKGLSHDVLSAAICAG